MRLRNSDDCGSSAQVLPNRHSFIVQSIAAAYRHQQIRISGKSAGPIADFRDGIAPRCAVACDHRS